MEKRDLRRAEIFMSGKWVPIAFQDIHRNHIFRLFDDVPNPIENGEPCVALDEPYVDSSTMVGIIRCEDLKNLIIPIKDVAAE